MVEEILPVVNEKDEIVDYVARKLVHEKGLRHREVAVMIVNSKNKIWLQQRRDNKRWGSSVGGHVPKGEAYLDAAVRECFEETGIKTTPNELKEISYYRRDGQSNNRSFVKVYLLKRDISSKDITLDLNESITGKFFSLDEVKELVSSKEKQFTSPVEKFYEVFH